MTMPSDDEINAMFPTHPDFGETTRMVPADIAEELARALGSILESIVNDVDGIPDISPTVSAVIALTRYHAITH